MALSIKPIPSGTLPTPAKGTLYTVPALTTAMILDATIVNTSAGTLAVNLYVKTAAGTSKHISSNDQNVGAKSRVSMGAGVVVDAGGLIEGDAAGAGVEYHISILEKT